MMHDDELAVTYSDLLPSNARTDGENQQDTDLRLLIFDLDRVLAGASVPPLLEERIAAVLSERALRTRPSRSVIRPLPQRHTERGYGRAGYASTGAVIMMPKRISTIVAGIVAFVVVALIALLLLSAHASGGIGGTGTGGGTFQDRWLQLGGTQTLLAVETAPGSPAISSDIRTIERRLATQVGSGDVNVFAYSPNYHLSNVIVVEFAGHAASESPLLSLVGEVGHFAIVDTGSTPLPVGTDLTGETCTTTCTSTQYKVVFTGDELNPGSIQASIDSQTDQPVVQFEFQGAAQSAFATYTKNNIGNYLTITLDNKVIESATINSQITGMAEISGGGMTVADARNLAALLQSGPLAAPVKVIVETSSQPGTPVPVPATTCRAAATGSGTTCVEQQSRSTATSATATSTVATGSPTVTPVGPMPTPTWTAAPGSPTVTPGG